MEFRSIAVRELHVGDCLAMFKGGVSCSGGL